MLGFVTKFVSTIDNDKVYHLVLGAATGITVLGLNPLLALALGQVAGLGKEIYDYKTDGTVEFADYAATVAANSLVVLLLGLV